MEKQGTVVKLSGNIADILIKRDSACGENCAACGLCKNNELSLSLEVPEGTKCGDLVRLVSEDKEVVKFSAAGYLGLTALLIAGGVLGTALGWEWLGFLLAVAFAFGGTLLIRKVSPKGVQIKVEKI